MEKRRDLGWWLFPQALLQNSKTKQESTYLPSMQILLGDWL